MACWHSCANKPNIPMVLVNIFESLILGEINKKLKPHLIGVSSGWSSVLLPTEETVEKEMEKKYEGGFVCGSEMMSSSKNSTFIFIMIKFYDLHPFCHTHTHTHTKRH